MAASHSNLIVEIDGEKHQIDVVPAATSKVVLAEKEKLLCLVDLKTLVEDLGRVGAFIHVAYNGVGAAGPRYTELQIEIQQLGYDIAKQCETSALTVSKFKNASATVLSHLKATYGYLLDNLEDMALQTLSSVAKIAEDMAKDALTLHDEFEKLLEKVVRALNNTQRAKSEELRHIKEKAKEYQELEEKQKHLQKLLEENQRLEQEAEAQRRQTEAKEDEAISSIPFIGRLKGLINTLFGVEAFDDGSAAETKAQYWKEKRFEALKQESKYRQMRYDALERMASFTAKIRDSPLKENTAAVAAVDALHEAITALKELSSVTMHTVHFWKQMQEHCRALAEEEMKSMVEMAMKEYSGEKRIKLWTTDGFKEQAIHFYAGWVALKDFCTEYFDQIRLTQEDLYKYLKENPTHEECCRNIHKLSELRRDQKEREHKIKEKD